MRFIIYRASDSQAQSSMKTPPCKNAIVVEERKPILEGIRDENGRMIYFDTGKTKTLKHWEVEINTLEELLELQTEVGSSLIFDRDSIEIYDDYIE